MNVWTNKKAYWQLPFFRFIPRQEKRKIARQKNKRGSEFRRRRTRDRAGVLLRRASWTPSWWDGRSSRPRRRSDERDDDGQSQEGQRRPPRLHPASRYASLTDESETFRPCGRLGDRTPAASARRVEGQDRCRVARAITVVNKKSQGQSDDEHDVHQFFNWLHDHDAVRSRFLD